VDGPWSLSRLKSVASAGEATNDEMPLEKNRSNLRTVEKRVRRSVFVESNAG
jgi:hypothetical protein